MASALVAAALVPPALGASPAASQDQPGSGQVQEAPSEVASRILSLLDLADMEYADAVSDGQVVDAAEYEEATQFTAEAASELGQLVAATRPAAAGELSRLMASLAAAVESRSSPDHFRSQVGLLRPIIQAEWDAVSVRFPDGRPSAARGAELYRESCAACHGASGAGDGPEGADLEPPATDLTSSVRRLGATPARDYQVVSYGIPATAMAGWSDLLTFEDRWAVVTYVQSLRHGAHEVAEGRSVALSETSPIRTLVHGWSQLPTTAELTDADLAERVRGQWAVPDAAQREAIVAFLRWQLGTDPEGLPAADPEGVPQGVQRRLAGVDSLITQAAEFGAAGSVGNARSTALEAYLMFEGVETRLRARSAVLASRAEAGFSDFRAALGTPGAAAAETDLRLVLSEAKEVFKERPSDWSLAVQSFFIILREGFEAILIIGAVIAFLVKTGNADRRRDIRLGVTAALVASVVTALALEGLFRAVPASQEFLEGVTMLVAVVVLFSVSYWLVSKLDHRRWNEFLHTRMNTALKTGSGLALGGVAFLAVYREGFETVLFYKALMGFGQDTLIPVAGGFLVGCLGLALIYTMFTRFGLRVPMRPFFALTSGILYYMAFVFAGKGVHELQEAGSIGFSPISGAPSLPALGIYPTVETLALQAALLIALVVALVITFRPRRTPAAA
ncbi:MAG: cytochrome c/FTR1 family iron permease [Gemmatimonadota bacterium]